MLPRRVEIKRKNKNSQIETNRHSFGNVQMSFKPL